MPMSKSLMQCPRCGDEIANSDRFCKGCGAQLPANSTRRLIDGYIISRIDGLLKERLTDEESLVRELTDKVEKKVFGRLWYGGILIAVGTFLFGLAEIRSWKDASADVQKVIDQASQNAMASDRASQEAMSRGVAADQSAATALGTAKTTQGNVLAQSDKATSLLTSLSNRMAAESERLNAQLQGLQAQASTAAQLNQTITTHEAFPWIYESNQLQLAQKPFKLVAEPNKRRVHIWVARSPINIPKFDAFEAAIKNAGYTLVEGQFTILPSGAGWPCLGGFTGNLTTYFNRSAEQSAVQVQLISSRFYNFPSRPTLNNVKVLAEDDPVRYVVDHASLDLEVCINAPT